MKKYILFLFLTLTGLVCQSQDSTKYYLEFILGKKTEFVDIVSTKITINKLYLKSPFASPEILNPGDISQIRGKTIEKIELVYTSYKLVDEFSNTGLNRQRLEALNSIAPELITNELIDWRIIAQTSCDSPEEGRHLFHGFIITFRPEATMDITEKEIAYLDAILEGKAPESIEVIENDIKKDDARVDIRDSGFEYDDVDEMPDFPGGKKGFYEFLKKNLKYPSKLKRKIGSGTVMVTFIVDKEGNIKHPFVMQGIDPDFDKEAIDMVMKMPKWKPASSKGEPVDVVLTVPVTYDTDNKRWEVVYLYSGTPVLGSESSMSHSTPVMNYYVPDSTVIKIFSRHEEWNNMAIICDFTGSMYPYTAQLLVWYNLKLKTDTGKIKLFTFFNDGNSTPDNKKKIGSTGGIYHGELKTFDEVKELAYITMRSGGGGDCPENNLEAIIEAIRRCPECKNIILIADNYATPRDLDLISKIKKPIHVILCGTYGGVNIDYLNFVRRNKGSLHTIEYDIENLMEINEGETIRFGDKTYIIKNGSFQPFHKL